MNFPQAKPPFYGQGQFWESSLCLLGNQPFGLFIFCHSIFCQIGIGQKMKRQKIIHSSESSPSSSAGLSKRLSFDATGSGAFAGAATPGTRLVEATIKFFC